MVQIVTRGDDSGIWRQIDEALALMQRNEVVSAMRLGLAPNGQPYDIVLERVVHQDHLLLGFNWAIAPANGSDAADGSEQPAPSAREAFDAALAAIDARQEQQP